MQSLQFIAYMADVHADMKVYETTSPPPMKITLRNMQDAFLVSVLR